MWKRKMVRVVISRWVMVLAMVVFVDGAMSAADQTNPEPDNGGGFCIDCHEHQD